MSERSKAVDAFREIERLALNQLLNSSGRRNVNAKPGELLKKLSEEQRRDLANLKSEDLNDRSI